MRFIGPVRGHDHATWVDELAPALRWLLEPLVHAPLEPHETAVTN